MNPGGVRAGLSSPGSRRRESPARSRTARRSPCSRSATARRHDLTGEQIDTLLEQQFDNPAAGQRPHPPGLRRLLVHVDNAVAAVRRRSMRPRSTMQRRPLNLATVPRHGEQLPRRRRGRLPRSRRARTTARRRGRPRRVRAPTSWRTRPVSRRRSAEPHHAGQPSLQLDGLAVPGDHDPRDGGRELGAREVAVVDRLEVHADDDGDA